MKNLGVFLKAIATTKERKEKIQTPKVIKWINKRPFCLLGSFTDL